MPTTALAGEVLGDTGSDFTYDKLVRIATGLVEVLLELAGFAAVIMITYYGVRMVLSRGEPGKFSEAKKGLLLAMLGAAIIFGVWTIIATVREGVRSIG